MRGIIEYLMSNTDAVQSSTHHAIWWGFELCVFGCPSQITTSVNDGLTIH